MNAGPTKPARVTHPEPVRRVDEIGRSATTCTDATSARSTTRTGVGRRHQPSTGVTTERFGDMNRSGSTREHLDARRVEPGLLVRLAQRRGDRAVVIGVDAATRERRLAGVRAQRRRPLGDQDVRAVRVLAEQDQHRRATPALRRAAGTGSAPRAGPMPRQSRAVGATPATRTRRVARPPRSAASQAHSELALDGVAELVRGVERTRRAPRRSPRRRRRRTWSAARGLERRRRAGRPGRRGSGTAGRSPARPASAPVLEVEVVDPEHLARGRPASSATSWR